MRKAGPQRSGCLESLLLPLALRASLPGVKGVLTQGLPGTFDLAGGQKTIQEKCRWLWVCLSLGLLRAGEGLGCRQGMLFKTEKEMLAQNGKERKQLPVSVVLAFCERRSPL